MYRSSAALRTRRDPCADARFVAWPPEDDSDRPPHRGLRPLEAGEAGIFPRVSSLPDASEALREIHRQSRLGMRSPEFFRARTQ